MLLTTSSCCSRGEGKQHRQLSILSSRESRFLRLLPAKSLTPATSFSQGPPQAAIPTLMFCHRCRQTLTAHASFNSPLPSTSASNDFRPLLVGVTIIFKMSTSFTHSLSQTHTHTTSLTLSHTQSLSLSPSSLLCVCVCLIYHFCNLKCLILFAQK